MLPPNFFVKNTKTFFPTFIFSFLSLSLYIGFAINSVIVKISVVIKYAVAPPTPYFIKFPINDTIITPKAGTDDAKHAPNILILNIEKSSLILTNDNKNEIIYTNIFFLENMLKIKFLSIFIVFSFIF